VVLDFYEEPLVPVLTKKIEGSGSSPAIFLSSHVPMERCYDGTYQNSKHKEERARSGIFFKNKKERMEERKRRDFFFNVLGGSHTRVFSISSTTPLSYRPCATLPQENPLVWEPPLQHVIVGSNRC
jgi:hypothetical protein